MDLKNANPNDTIVLARKLNPMDLYFETCKIKFINESNTLFSQEDAMIACKTKSPITFTPLIQME